DPPLYLFYPQANQPLPPNSEGPVHIHHPKFGEVIKAKMDAMGLECVLKYREDYPDLDTNKAAPWIDMAAFLNTKLKQADSGKQTEGEKPCPSNSIVQAWRA